MSSTQIAIRIAEKKKEISVHQSSNPSHCSSTGCCIKPGKTGQTKTLIRRSSRIGRNSEQPLQVVEVNLPFPSGSSRLVDVNVAVHQARHENAVARYVDHLNCT